MTKIETFEPDPEAGRPMLLTLSGREGKLSAHVERETLALYFFADGPRGGNQGRAVVPVHVAEQLSKWLDEGRPGGFYHGGGTHSFWLADDGWTMVRYAPRSIIAQTWRLPLDEAALTALVSLMRDWVIAAMKHRAITALNSAGLDSGGRT